VTTAVVSGNTADDPLYVPEIKKVHRFFGQGGKTFVGDCKMAALATRAYVQSTGDFYLCPLSEKQMSQQDRQERLAPVWSGKQALQPVYRPTTDPDDEPELVAEGFCFDVAQQDEVDGKLVRWTERRWLVRSVAFAQGQQAKLHKRLTAATEELNRLAQRKQGKKRLDAAGLQAAAEAVLAEHRVVDLLSAQVVTEQRAREVRGYRGQPGRVEVEPEHQLEVKRDEAAIAQTEREMGWQVYAVNNLEMTLSQVVCAYRGQYRIEDGWSRLKGQPLGLTPMYLTDEKRMQGLVNLLSLGLRLLTLVEWIVRERLQKEGTTVRGIYAGQPGRKTNRPSAELLLRALKTISVSVIEVNGLTHVLLAPLTQVQKRLLDLWGLPPDLYDNLARAFPKLPMNTSEP
jgi:transposase